MPTQAGIESEQIRLSKKDLGAFYTPHSVADVVARWAIQSKTDCVLEPGFGGCGFLEAAVSRLKSLGSAKPQRQLFGCDIDPKAFGYLSEKLGVLTLNRRYILKDFIATTPDDFSIGRFDVVFGNPPYVSLHAMRPAQRRSIQSWRCRNEVSLNRRASLWAYFVIHGMSFLKPGGRMAWVLPGSLLQSDYSRALIKAVVKQFSTVVAFNLTERVFLLEGTEERSVVLACDGFGGKSSSCVIRHCESVDELSGILLQTKLEHFEFRQNRALEAYEEIAAGASAQRLGDSCNVLIGTVTGANKFFIMRPSFAESRGISRRYLRPIAPKLRFLSGLNVSKRDVKGWWDVDSPCFLFHVPDRRISKSVKKYCSTFKKAQREANVTFGKRKGHWLEADDNRIPDAFLSYMTHEGPRIVINTAKVNSTNSIHRIYFRRNISSAQRKLITISLFTTFSQLSAEIEGRSYGAGVLKLEPSEARNLRIVLPTDLSNSAIHDAYVRLDRELRDGNAENATAVADALIFGHRRSSRRIEIQPLTTLLATMRKRRQRTLECKPKN